VCGGGGLLPFYFTATALRYCIPTQLAKGGSNLLVTVKFTTFTFGGKFSYRKCGNRGGIYNCVEMRGALGTGDVRWAEENGAAASGS